MTELTPHKRGKRDKAERMTSLSLHYGNMPTPPAGLLTKQGKHDQFHPDEGGLCPEMEDWESKNGLTSPPCGWSNCPDIDTCNGICILGDIEGFLKLFKEPYNET